jgi:protein-tyrosine phosphatase
MDYLPQKDENGITKVPVKKSVNKAWCLKRLVSKKKRRFENEMFDLDMAYVTKRVIAMGYPATGFEKMYRNSINDVIRFFHFYHNDNVKIYNLCLEKDRIYEKSLFSKSQVGLFPATDHNPCPIKLILEFCVDICLYLIKNPDGVAAIHCKAGKGRTGVMICSYLIFSGLCKTSEDAFAHYAAARTYNHKGVTIPSQIRYIQYFETFLASNFCPPYIFLIPKIVKYHINRNTTNILKNFSQDKTYFISPNEFFLKSIKIGPLNSNSSIDIKICDFVNTNVKIEKFGKDFEKISIEGKTWYNFILTINERIKIDSDIKISASGGVDSYFWVNLWYSSLDIIKTFLDKFHQDQGPVYRHMRAGSFGKAALEMNNLMNNDGMYNNILIFFEIIIDSAKRDLITKRNLFEAKGKEANSPVNIEMSNVASTTKAKSNNLGIEESIDIKRNQYDDSDEEINDKKPGLVLNSARISMMSRLDIEKNKNSGYISSISEPNEDDNLFDILFKLKHNTNLNVLINHINKIIKKQNKTPFDKTNMNISLTAKELDKFSKVKSMNPNFAVNICFSLADNEK